MTPPADRPPPPWDPLGLWRQVAPMASQMAGLARPLAATASELGSLGAKTGLQVLLEVARSRLVGRRLELGTDERPLQLTLCSIDMHLDPVLLTLGQSDRAALVAQDVEWGDLRFRSAHAELHNLHTRPGTHPLLVSAPVDIEAVMPVEWLAERLARRTSRVALEVTESGTARLRLEWRPELGYLDLSPRAEGQVVMLRPSGVGARSRNWALTRLLPPLVLDLGLPDGVRIVELRLEPDGLRMRLRADEWRLDYLEWLSFAGRPRGPVVQSGEEGG